MSIPTVVFDDFWIHAQSPEYSEILKDYVGKWMLFIPAKRINETWDKIKRETESGNLGIAAKTATMMPNARSNDSFVQLICVYTKDFSDLEDVKKVLGKLRDLGFAGRLNYKEDEATRSDIYGKGASLYTTSSGLEIKQMRAPIEPNLVK